MANKKISELQTRTPSLSDLILVGDPSNGFSYKCTVSALATIIETDIADGYVTLGTTQTISGAKTFSNNLTLTSVANASTDPDKFLVLNGSNVVNYRTGSEVLSDIGGQGTITLTTTGTSGAATFAANTLNIPQYQGVITLTTTGTSGAATLVGNTLNIPNYAPDLSGYVPTSRTITINGTTQDLTANRTYNVGTVTSVAASGGTGISISGSPITSSGTITITNTAPDQVVTLTAGTGISISGTYPNFTITNSSPSLGGTVTSVALSAPTGFAVTGSPITSSGTLALAFASGYSLPTTASQTNWDSAYNNMIVSAAVTGTTTKTLTLTQQDAGTITASWTDDNTDAVTSVFGRTGAVVATEGDYSLTQLSDVTITTPSTGQVLKYNGTIWVNDTDANTGTVTSVALSAPTGFSVSGSPITSSGTLALSFASGYSLPTTASQANWDTAYTNRITSLTTTGSSGAATLISNTLNIPNYTLAGLGGISLTSLSAFVPLSYNNTTGQFSIDKATTTSDGYLSATDWTTFNNKQATITLTTTGTSGAATFTSNTLNIPQYQGALTLTTTGTSGAATLVGNTLNIPQYSGGGGSVSGTTNYIAKFTSSTAVGNSQIFDDGTNVGVGTATAGSKLQINGNAAIGYSASTAAPTNGLAVSGNVAIGRSSAYITLTVNGSIGAVTNDFVASSTGTIVFIKTGTTTGNTYASIGSGTGGDVSAGNVVSNEFGGNFGINTTTIGSRLQVNGNAAIGYSASTAAPTNGLAVAGNIGVGTNTAADMVTVGTTTTGGNVRVVSSSYGTNGIFRAYGTDGNEKLQMGGLANTQAYIYTPASIDLLLFTGAAERARLNASGVFFIGNGETNGTPALGIISATGGTGTNIAGAEFRIRGGASTGSGAGGPITFYTSAAGSAGTGVNAATERMRLTSGGNIGIRTTNPFSELEVNSGTGTAPTLKVYSSPSSYTANLAVGIIDFGSNASGNDVPAFRITGVSETAVSSANGYATFSTRLSGTVAERMRLTSGGSLGIATTTPGSILQVNGNAAIGYSASTAAPTNGLAVSGTFLVGTTDATNTDKARINNDGTSVYSTIRMSNANSTANMYVGVGGSAVSNTALRNNAYVWNAAATALAFGTSDVEAMRITSGGASASVGIGTSTIGSKLQVNGNAAIGYSASTAAPTNGLAVAGVVGIGSNSVTNGTTVYGGSNQVNVLKLSSSGYPALEVNSTSDGGGSIQFTHGVNLPNQARALIGYNSGGATVLDFNIINIANGPIIFGTNNTNRMTITGGGQVTLATGANVSAIAQTGYSLTGSNAQSLIDLAGTWNTTGNPTAIKLNITNTASGATADLMELQVGGVSQFTVTKGGAIQTSNPTGGTAKPWKLGEAVATTVTLTGYAVVEIDGTAYKLALVTAN